MFALNSLLCGKVLNLQLITMKIKRLPDELAIPSQPLKCDDIITYFLARLGPKYGSLVSIVSHHDNSLTLEEIHSMLLTCEAYI